MLAWETDVSSQGASHVEGPGHHPVEPELEPRKCNFLPFGYHFLAAFLVALQDMVTVQSKNAIHGNNAPIKVNSRGAYPSGFDMCYMPQTFEFNHHHSIYNPHYCDVLQLTEAMGSSLHTCLQGHKHNAKRTQSK